MRGPCEFCEEVADLCDECHCCETCCGDNHLPEEEEDPEWDEDFGGYPDEEPARYARYCRAMSRAAEAGVD